MAKESEITDISPTLFNAKGQVAAEHWQGLIKHQNWVRSNRARVYLSANTSPAANKGGWDSGNGLELATTGIFFNDDLPFTIKLETEIVTPPSVSSLKVAARCLLSVGHGGTVRFTYFVPPGSSASVDLPFAPADLEKFSLLDISGVRDPNNDTRAFLQVLLSRTAGTGPTSAVLRNVRVLDDLSAIGTPSPVI